MNISEFDYYLPDELIAQTPATQRDNCRLLIYNKSTNKHTHTSFSEIINNLTADDVLVLNNSKVLPCRITFNHNNKEFEILLIKKISQGKYDCMIRPGKKFKIGKFFEINSNLICEVEEHSDTGRIISFYLNPEEPADDDILFAAGDIPLPPYITNYNGDKSFYQTVYSKINGSTAAPTAGLHFTDELLQSVKKKICDVLEITLHIGPGTFQPIKCENINEHKMHSEFYNVDAGTYSKLLNYKKNGKRIIAVGTTAVRTLETVFADISENPRLSGETDIFIFPGFEFKCIDAMITNFHLPRSSLFVMISAFIGKENALRLYNEAISERYRFFSFGDAMFLF